MFYGPTNVEPSLAGGGIMKVAVLCVVSALVCVESVAQGAERSYVASFACGRDNLTGKRHDIPGVLVVHVMDWQGEPLPGAAVQVSRGKAPVAKLASDAAGRTVLKELPEGTYTVGVLMRAFYRGESRVVDVHRGCTTALSFPLQVVDLRH